MYHEYSKFRTGKIGAGNQALGAVRRTHKLSHISATREENLQMSRMLQV